jgi:tRNA dimethylallyltransferase
MMAKGAGIITILGPTSTGKSDLAVWLAPGIRGEIINADSMQVYRRFDIGSGKPDRAAREEIPHHIVDVVEPDEEFNAAVFQRIADLAIEDVVTRAATPLVVGGTGLYLRALLHGLFPARSDPELRERLKRQYLEKPVQMYEELKVRDPEYALAVSPHDKVRVVRALEISYVTGITMSEWRARHGFQEQRYHALKIGLTGERQELYRKINKRVDSMLAAGWVDEVKGLIEAGWSPELKPFQSIGYREIVLYLNGKLKYPEMVEKIKTATRHYAKRQMTWFSQEDGTEWYEYPAERVAILERIRRFLN